MSQKPAIHRFRRYVASEGPNWLQTRDHLQALRSEHLRDPHQIGTEDAVREPARPLKDNVPLTPRLVTLSLPPARKVIGPLVQTPVVPNDWN
ncbi:MAG: hypothetical protein JWO89_2731 [Verrucomicrobiaceae bacterium]|nr:hypothetical protein [Verrucomicrobiaceae bacterium]